MDHKNSCKVIKDKAAFLFEFSISTKSVYKRIDSKNNGIMMISDSMKITSQQAREGILLYPDGNAFLPPSYQGWGSH
jgi:hypothetical protein